MPFIDLTSSTYSNLSQYGVLATGGLTASGLITVNNGYWYGSSGNLALTAGLPPSGYNNTISTTALSELITLISNIQTVTSSLPNTSIGIGGSNYTFLPNRNYTGTSVIYSSNTITFDAVGDANAQFYITGGSFAITSTTIVLANGARQCNIFWFADDGLNGTFTSTNSSIPGVIVSTGSYSSINNSTPSNTFTGHIFSRANASLTRSGTGGPVTINSVSCPVVCYAKGTLILTNRGFVPIEHIKAGDNVVTKGKIYNNKSVDNDADAQFEPVRWVSRFKVVDLDSKTRPICIKKDALGENRPFKDLYVSPGHRLLLNGKMVVAKNIVNGKTICQDTECEKVEYYHVECDYHSAIFANGVLAESYLEENNRHVFENSIRLPRKLHLKKMHDLR